MAFLYGGVPYDVRFDAIPLKRLMALFGRSYHLGLALFDVKITLTHLSKDKWKAMGSLCTNRVGSFWQITAHAFPAELFFEYHEKGGFLNKTFMFYHFESFLFITQLKISCLLYVKQWQGNVLSLLHEPHKPFRRYQTKKKIIPPSILTDSFQPENFSRTKGNIRKKGIIFLTCSRRENRNNQWQNNLKL